MTNNLRRFLIILAVSAGLVTASSIPASAGLALANHCATLLPTS